jgi:hypothetical protein
VPVAADLANYREQAKPPAEQRMGRIGNLNFLGSDFFRGIKIGFRRRSFLQMEK